MIIQRCTILGFTEEKHIMYNNKLLDSSTRMRTRSRLKSKPLLYTDLKSGYKRDSNVFFIYKFSGNKYTFLSFARYYVIILHFARRNRR